MPVHRQNTKLVIQVRVLCTASPIIHDQGFLIIFIARDRASKAHCERHAVASCNLREGTWMLSTSAEVYLVAEVAFAYGTDY